MIPYRERLWPAPWMFVATALVIPASLLVFLPISLSAGVVTAIVLYAACVALLLAAAPSIEIDATGLRAGRATLPADAVGTATGYRDEDAVEQRGPALDVRAFLLIRGWVAPVVRVLVDDPRDPTPYWLVSTRRPEEVVAALEALRAGSTPRTPGR